MQAMFARSPLSRLVRAVIRVSRTRGIVPMIDRILSYSTRKLQLEPPLQPPDDLGRLGTEGFGDGEECPESRGFEPALKLADIGSV